MLLFPLLRLTLSDGDHYGHAVIRNQHVPESGLREGYLVRLEQYVCKELVDGIKVIVIGKLKIEEKSTLEKIGCPRLVQDKESKEKKFPPEGRLKKKQQRQLQQHKTLQEGQKRKKEKTLEGDQIMPVPYLNLLRRRDPVDIADSPSNKFRKVQPQGQAQKLVNKALFGTDVPKAQPLQLLKAPPHQGIRFINPYLNRWQIKGRCSFKGELHHFQTQNQKEKTGVLFSFQLTDNTGSIDITAFTQVAQTFFDQIHLDRVYIVSNGHLRVAHSKFNRSTSFYEMLLHDKSVVREVADDGSIIASTPKFVKIRDLLRTRANSFVDVLGVIEEISELAPVSLRSSGKEVMRRTITILDNSKASVSLSLWGKNVDLLKRDEQKSGKILMVRGARRSYYQGIKLTVGRRTTLTVNPKMEEAARLRTWYFRETGKLGKSQFLRSILHLTRLEDPLKKEDRMTLTMGKKLFANTARTSPQLEKQSEKRSASSFIMRGRIVEIRQDITMSYPSDPFTKKKVEEIAPGLWYSASSDRNFCEDLVKWRYALWVRVADETGDAWMCAFDEAAQVFLGHSASEMEELKEKEKKKWKRILNDACFKPLIIEVIAKSKRYRGEFKLHYVMNRVEFVNFGMEGRVLLREIHDYVSSLMNPSA